MRYLMIVQYTVVHYQPVIESVLLSPRMKILSPRLKIGPVSAYFTLHGRKRRLVPLKWVVALQPQRLAGNLALIGCSLNLIITRLDKPHKGEGGGSRIRRPNSPCNKRILVTPSASHKPSSMLPGAKQPGYRNNMEEIPAPQAIHVLQQIRTYPPVDHQPDK